jgi:hypothetical protein
MMRDRSALKISATTIAAANARHVAVPAGAPEIEIEVTPAMIEAGRCALFDSWDDYPDVPGVGYVLDRMVSRVFREMEKRRCLA